MPRLCTGVVVLAVLVSLQAQESDTKAAQTSVEFWLALADRGQYADSWDRAASYFKNAITREKWQEALRGVRMPLGALKSRILKSATPTTSLPGAPDGQYVVFQFQTTFEHKQSALETVTAIREKDGQWRVVGYFIE